MTVDKPIHNALTTKDRLKLASESGIEEFELELPGLIKGFEEGLVDPVLSNRLALGVIEQIEAVFGKVEDPARDRDCKARDQEPAIRFHSTQSEDDIPANVIHTPNGVFLEDRTDF